MVTNLMLNLFLNFATAALILGGDVYICLRQPQNFLCEAPKQGSLTRLEWTIDFEDSHSVESVTRQYTSNDPEGLILRDDRPGIRFVFNLTSNSPSSLVSVMTVTVDDISATTSINNTTVTCGDPYPKVVHVHKGPPSFPLNLIQDLMQVQWNPVDMADHYIISVSPPVESGSIFITSNTTIQFPFQYNQEYNVSVMASNCAGNSTPVEINIRIGCCTYPPIGLMVYVLVENNATSCGMGGSYITYSCQPGLVPSERRMAYCMRDGSWNPNPNELECHLMTKTNITTNSPTLGVLNRDIIIPAVTVSLLVFSILMFITGLLFGTLLIKYIPKSPKRNDEVSMPPAPGSVPMYEEIQLPTICTAQDVMQVKDNEAYGHIQRH